MPPTDVQSLQAHSQQLQERIGLLEAVGKKRDQQLQKMISRVDGATKMLTAVDEMCNQQRRVIDAQTAAISELRSDCGGCSEGAPSPPAPLQPTTASTAANNQRRAAAAVAVAAPSSPAADQLDQMQQLLKQAHEMQNALQELKSAEHSELGAVAAALRAGGAVAAAGSNSEEEAEEDEEEEELAKGREVIAKLHSLEAEKQHFEDMLQNSQAEHESLVGRLTEMRALLSALGVDGEADSEAADDDDDDDDDYGNELD